MAGACVCRLQRLQADAGSDSLLFSIGYRWGISIDRLFSTTSLKRIRENCTSRHGKKKELRSVGPPRLPPTFSSLKSTTSGRGRIRTYVENLQQIYSLSLLTARPLSPSRGYALLKQRVPE
jgi:hypothetical protein